MICSSSRISLIWSSSKAASIKYISDFIWLGSLRTKSSMERHEDSVNKWLSHIILLWILASTGKKLTSEIMGDYIINALQIKFLLYYKYKLTYYSYVYLELYCKRIKIHMNLHVSRRSILIWWVNLRSLLNRPVLHRCEKFIREWWKLPEVSDERVSSPLSLRFFLMW